MDLATATGRDFDEIAVDGLAYRLGELNLARWGALQAFLKQHGPHPVAECLAQLARADAQGVPIKPEREQYLLAEARKEAKGWPPRPGTGEFFEALARTEGGETQFLWEILKVHQPTMTVEQAAEVNRKLSADESIRVWSAALGIKANKPTEGGGPKGEAPTGRGPTPGTTSSASSPNGSAGPGPTSANLPSASSTPTSVTSAGS